MNAMYMDVVVEEETVDEKIERLLNEILEGLK